VNQQHHEQKLDEDSPESVESHVTPCRRAVRAEALVKFIERGHKR
jgi:hypothetical protein